jgi:septum site-determining protein MinC
MHVVHGKSPIAFGCVLMLRGTKSGLEFVFASEAGEAELSDLVARLAERPDFYRGSRATAIFHGPPLEEAGFGGFLATVREHGIELDGVYGAAEVEVLAQRHALPYLGEPPRPVVTALGQRRPRRVVAALTDRARSLDADFAGAREDIARRRARGEPSVAKPDFSKPATPRAAPSAPAVAGVAAAVAGQATLYHRGTLRGGQILQQIGNIVVVGDVNPGAELVASGDILVFGALRGTAHAGAQGDAGARVAALVLAPTQLRIAAYIAADDARRKPREPEVAFVRDERIAIAPHARVGLR